MPPCCQAPHKVRLGPYKTQLGPYKARLGPYKARLGPYKARLGMFWSGPGTAPGMRRQILAGVLAGAAGTTALNALTYLDMAVRGRPSSDMPEQAVERTASKVGARIPGDEETRSNRVSGLGPLTGVATGVGIGAVYGVAVGLFGRPPLAVAGLLVGAGAMAGTDVPMVASGLTDPRSWGVAGWLSDIVPHIAYGYATAATVQLAG